MRFYIAGHSTKESSPLFLTLGITPPWLGFSNLTLTFSKPSRPRAICRLLARHRLTPIDNTIYTISWKEHLCCWFYLRLPSPLSAPLGFDAPCGPTCLPLCTGLWILQPHSRRPFLLLVPDSGCCPICFPISIPVFLPGRTIISLASPWASPSSRLGLALKEMFAWIFTKSCSPSCVHP